MFALVFAVALQLSSQHSVAGLPSGVYEISPAVAQPYVTTPPLPQYRNEILTYVVDPDERERYRLRFGSDGFIYDASGKKFDTRDAVRIDEHGVRSLLKLAMFVMDAAGHFYASNFQQVHVFHHSSLVGGDEVAAAGELEVLDGRLEFINDRSGHYRQPPQFIEQALDRLRQLLPPGTVESLRKNNKILIGGYQQ